MLPRIIALLIAFLLSTSSATAQPPAPTTPAYADPAAWAAATDITQLRALRDQLLASPDPATTAVTLLDVEAIAPWSDAQSLLHDALIRLGPRATDALLKPPYRTLILFPLGRWIDTLPNHDAQRVLAAWSEPESRMSSALLPFTSRLAARGVDTTPYVTNWMIQADLDRLLHSWREAHGDKRLRDAGKALIDTKWNTAYYILLAADRAPDAEIAAQALKVADRTSKDWNAPQPLEVAARYARDVTPVQRRILDVARASNWLTPHALAIFPYLDTTDPEVAEAFIRINAATSTNSGNPIEDSQRIWRQFTFQQRSAIIKRFSNLPLSDRLELGGSMAAFDSFAQASDKALAESLDAIDVKTLKPDSPPIALLGYALPKYPLLYAAALRLYTRTAAECPPAFPAIEWGLAESFRKRAFETVPSDLETIPEEVLAQIPRGDGARFTTRATAIIQILSYAQSLPSDLADPLISFLDTYRNTAGVRDSETYLQALRCLAALEPPPDKAVDWLIQASFPSPPEPAPANATFNPPPKRAALLALTASHPRTWERLESQRHNLPDDAIDLIASVPAQTSLLETSPAAAEVWALPADRVPAILASPRLQTPEGAQLRTRILRRAVLCDYRDDDALAEARRTLTTELLTKESDPTWAAVALVVHKEPGVAALLTNLLDDERPRIRKGACAGLRLLSNAELAAARPKLLREAQGDTLGIYATAFDAADILIAIDGDSPDVQSMLKTYESSGEDNKVAAAEYLRAFLKKTGALITP